MPTIDEKVVVVRDADWQYVRIPTSVSLPGDELELHQYNTNGPITLLPIHPKLSPDEEEIWMKGFFDKVDEARAAGETFKLEREFCPPRDVEI